VKQVLQEALLVAVVGAALALGANGLSPRGLTLTRDYKHRNSPPGTNQVVAHTATNSISPAEKLAAEIKARGLQLAGSNQVIQFFHDPGYTQGLMAFVDARHPEDYEKGHIPSAYLFDYAHPELYLTNVMPACQVALQVVVYCNGGECDDSMNAALFLGGLVPKERLFIYGGGITEWRSNTLPIELGQRNSGQLLNAKP
jgi:rhodanese-related sulfurtransferase